MSDQPRQVFQYEHHDPNHNTFAELANLLNEAADKYDYCTELGPNDEMKLGVELEQCLADLERARAALLLIEEHHVRLNASRGRPEGESFTLRQVRRALRHIGKPPA